MADLFKLAGGQLPPDAVVGDGGDRSQRTRLGAAIKKRVDRVQGDFRVRAAAPDHSGRQRYRLPCADTAASRRAVAESTGRSRSD